MLVHKGGQINNVQLINRLRIAEMSQLQNCIIMCTKNGSYCEHEKKERKSQRGGGMCTKNGSYCEKEKKSQEGGQGRCERRSEAFVKIHFFFYFFFYLFIFFLGGGGRVGRGQGGCELRSEAFVKIHKKKNFVGGGGGGGCRVGGVRVDVN